MSSKLLIQIQEDMKSALRAKDKLRLSTVRLLLAAIKQNEIDTRIKLTDLDIISLIQKMIKQRRAAITQYQQGQRLELAAKEQAEIEILQSYLPQTLTETEIISIIKLALSQTTATSVKDMAKVMAYIKKQARGRADMSRVSTILKSMLK